MQHGLRPGDRLALFDIPVEDQPREFWKTIARVGVRICYSSAFEEHWIVETKALGEKTTWRDVANCPAQADSAYF